MPESCTTTDRLVCRVRPAARTPYPGSAAILLTGGLGDVFALESYLTPEHRRRLTTVYHATRAEKAIRAAFAALPAYAHVRHVTLWDDFTEFFAFHFKDELTR